jgi:hypothetical protein
MRLHDSAIQRLTHFAHASQATASRSRLFAKKVRLLLSSALPLRSPLRLPLGPFFRALSLAVPTRPMRARPAQSHMQNKRTLAHAGLLRFAAPSIPLRPLRPLRAVLCCCFEGWRGPMSGSWFWTSRVRSVRSLRRCSRSTSPHLHPYSAPEIRTKEEVHRVDLTCAQEVQVRAQRAEADKDWKQAPKTGRQQVTRRPRHRLQQRQRPSCISLACRSWCIHIRNQFHPKRAIRRIRRRLMLPMWAPPCIAGCQRNH